MEVCWVNKLCWVSLRHFRRNYFFCFSFHVSFGNLFFLKKNFKSTKNVCITFDLSKFNYETTFLFKFFISFQSLHGCIPGVSSTQPVGHMWHAKCICSARQHFKNWQNYKFSSNLTYLKLFIVNCGLQKLFSNKLRPAEQFFFGMWPSDKFEFETSAVYGGEQWFSTFLASGTL
jgi:hypothetical protein